VDDIVKGTSMPRNQFLFTNANYLLPYTGAGSGILRALEEGLDVMFKNEERIHEFVIIIKREPGANNQEGIQETNRETNRETNQEKQIKVSLTKSQKDIVNFCSVPRTAQEILDRLGLTNHSANRKRHIQTLVDMGVLEMTIPEKPNDRNQKYRKRKK
jgi:predicted HTH transcriptional regulator